MYSVRRFFCWGEGFWKHSWGHPKSSKIQTVLMAFLAVGFGCGLARATPQTPSQTPVSQPTDQPLCNTWSRPRQIGTLESKFLPEASGLAFSKLVAGRLYHHNDSGNGGFFYLTNSSGGQTQKVHIGEFDASSSDFEAMATVTLEGKAYVVLADIGDNSAKKLEHDILFFEEQLSYPESINPSFRLKVRYPDHPHDAESLAVYPSGDLFILTKEWNLQKLQSFPDHLFKLPKEQVLATLHHEKSLEPSTPITLEPWGTLELNKLAPTVFNLLSQVPTDMSISPSGNHFLLLTYGSAFEFDYNLSSGPLPANWNLGKNVRQIRLKALEQQEGISYTPDGKGFVYSTEKRKLEPALMQLECVK